MKTETEHIKMTNNHGGRNNLVSRNIQKGTQTFELYDTLP
jgi:hypothetical protein